MTTPRMMGVLGVAFATACASAPVSKPAPYQVGTTSAPPVLPPAPATPVGRSASPDQPPTMASAQPSIVGMPSTRVSVSAKNEDVGAVITRMARDVGLTAIIDPAVRGPVTRSMQNVSLTDAMRSLVGDQYQYQVRNGALVVTPIQLVQHTYTVDYLAMSRISTGSTVVSRGTQGTASWNTSLVGPTVTGTVAAGGGGVVASGADFVQSSSQADVWGELTQQLESIIFGNASDSARALGAGGLNLAGPRPYTRCAGAVCLRISPLTSLVDVITTPDKQDEVSRYIALFTAAISRQVLIKAQVVEVSLDRSNSFGIDWQAVLSTARGIITASVKTGSGTFDVDPSSSVTGGNASFNLGIGDFALKAVITALETAGDVQVVAKPTTNAMNQQKASFNVTRQEQFFTTVRTPLVSPNSGLPTNEFIETQQIQVATVGLVFDVLPQISDKNVVLMSIRPSVTSIASRTTITGANGTVLASLPITEHRETDTMARVRSGETIMIGGLIQKNSTNVRSGIPVLMDIPFLGGLFSSTKVEEHSSELVIFLTPEIISGQPPGSP